MEFETVNCKSVMKKRLWNMLKFALFMIRRGLLKHRMLAQDFHMVMKRGKMFGKNLGSLMFHHHHHTSRSNSQYAFGVGAYEFSCSNSPANPSFNFTKRRHHYFPSLGLPCIHPETMDESARFGSVLQLDYDREYTATDSLRLDDFPSIEEPKYSSEGFDQSYYNNYDFVCGEDDEVVCSSPSSRSSSEDGQVDRQAEEFIARFYDQIKLQRQFSLSQYQEMLARGAS
eukprot:Gb_33753 [translate_table: standard]